MQEHSRTKGILFAKFSTALEHLKEIQNTVNREHKSRGKLEVRLTTWIPSCTITLIDVKENTGTIYIKVNSPSFRQPAKGTLSSTFTRKNNPLEVDYLVQQFDTLWHDDSRECDLETIVNK
jgi:hypothetical protein